MTREDRDGKNANPNYLMAGLGMNVNRSKVGKTDWHTNSMSPRR